MESGLFPNLPRFFVKNYAVQWFFSWLMAAWGGAILSISYGAVNAVRVDYVVDASEPSSKALQVRARILDLPIGEFSIALQSEKKESAAGYSRRAKISMASEEDRLISEGAEEGRWLLDKQTMGPIVLSYDLKSASLEQLDRKTYLDEERCIFHSLDALLVIEGMDENSTVTFVLPNNWKVITVVKKSEEGGYRLDQLRDIPFYLGDATEIHETLSGLTFSMAIESSWPVGNQDLWRNIRRLVSYRKRMAKDSRFQSILGIFMGKPKSRKRKETDSFQNTNLLVMSAPLAVAGQNVLVKGLYQELARNLVRFYFPSFFFSPEAKGQEKLLEYLTLKTSLKTGLITQREFLVRMAEELSRAFGQECDSKEPTKNQPRKKTSPEFCAESSALGNFFLSDLTLNYFGKNHSSLDDLVQSKTSARLLERLSLGEFEKTLVREKEVTNVLGRTTKESKPPGLNDILKPFGLVFERRELPLFPFELTENFEIERIQQTTESRQSPFQRGDKVVSIGPFRLLKPDDLLKCSSWVKPGVDIQITIERGGISLKIHQPVEKQVHYKLESNKLSDADKQEKFQKFLTRETEA